MEDSIRAAMTKCLPHPHYACPCRERAFRELLAAAKQVLETPIGGETSLGAALAKLSRIVLLVEENER